MTLLSAARRKKFDTVQEPLRALRIPADITYQRVILRTSSDIWYSRLVENSAPFHANMYAFVVEVTIIADLHETADTWTPGKHLRYSNHCYITLAGVDTKLWNVG